MSSKTGLSRRIIAWVEEHPGSLGREIGAALGFDHGSGLLNYLRESGRIWRAGPRHGGSYYADPDQAAANDERLREEARARSLAKMRAGWSKGHDKQRAARKAYRAEHAARLAAELAERKAATVQRQEDRRAVLVLARSLAGPGVTVLRSVRVTVATTPPPRYAPAPGFERVITGDWQQRMER